MIRDLLRSDKYYNTSLRRIGWAEPHILCKDSFFVIADCLAHIFPPNVSHLVARDCFFIGFGCFVYSQMNI